MTDVFISYAKQERALTEALAAALEKAGYTVWWDKQLLAGRRFEKEITAQIDACHSAVIIWTPTSAGSDWVQSEAEHARRTNKLINAVGGGLLPHEIPKPFDRFHAVPVEEHAEIIKAVRKGPAKARPGNDNLAFLEDSVREFLKHTRRLRRIAKASYSDEKAYTLELITAATMLAEPVDAFLESLPLKGLAYEDRVRVTALETVLPKVKYQLDKERLWLTKRFSSSVLDGARNDLTWASELLLEAIG